MKLPYRIKNPDDFKNIQKNFDYLGNKLGAPATVKSGVSFATVAAVSLGNFEGEKITGVRITGTVLTAGTGVNPVIRVRCNGLNPMQVMGLNMWEYWNTAAAAFGNDMGGNYANAGGMPIAQCNHGSTSNAVHFDGVLYTCHLNPVAVQPVYLGIYENCDRIVNSQQHLMGTMKSAWNDLATPITSLMVLIDTGTFSGKIATQVIP